jgi:hypothetical protein
MNIKTIRRTMFVGYDLVVYECRQCKAEAFGPMECPYSRYLDNKKRKVSLKPSMHVSRDSSREGSFRRNQAPRTSGARAEENHQFGLLAQASNPSDARSAAICGIWLRTTLSNELCTSR